MGKALLAAAAEDARLLGAKGMAAWGVLAQNLVYERAKRAAADLGDKVAFLEIDTSTRDAVAEWGIADAVLVDGKNLQQGPPPSYEKIRKVIAKRAARLR